MALNEGPSTAPPKSPESMFAAKLIALVVAFMAVAQVDAKKRKHHSRHHKKERIRSAVTRNCGAETASIVIDGLSQNLK